MNSTELYLRLLITVFVFSRFISLVDVDAILKLRCRNRPVVFLFNHQRPD